MRCAGSRPGCCHGVTTSPTTSRGSHAAGRAGGSLFGPYGDVRFVEGGDRSDEGRGRIGRYVRCDTDRSSTYHTCLVLAEMPSTWTFPGGAEFLAYLESAAETGADGEVIEADVCVRIRRIGNTEALRKVRRKRSKLAWQRGEYAGNITGVPGSLGTSAGLLDDMQATLEANRAEPELLCTVIVHLADVSLPRLERHAAALQAQFEPANFGLVRPIGEQLRLLSMMTPGSATTPPAADFAQHLLARDLAACLPLCGGGVGDDRGGLLGSLLDAGRNQPVMIDPGRGPAKNRSGNIAAVGGLGGGKSVTAKRLVETTVADGGQVITIDRTEAGEYVRFADALAGCGVSTQVIRLGVDTGVCLDPLRVFAGDERITVTVGFLSQLCAVDTGSLEATTLAEAVETVARRRDAAAERGDRRARRAWPQRRAGGHRPGPQARPVQASRLARAGRVRRWHTARHDGLVRRGVGRRSGSGVARRAHQRAPGPQDARRAGGRPGTAVPGRRHRPPIDVRHEALRCRAARRVLGVPGQPVRSGAGHRVVPGRPQAQRRRLAVHPAPGRPAERAA